MMSKKRKYNDLYIKWGFQKFVEKDGTEHLQCVSCYKVLAEASMKPAKLKASIQLMKTALKTCSEAKKPILWQRVL